MNKPGEFPFGGPVQSDQLRVADLVKGQEYYVSGYGVYSFEGPAADHKGDARYLVNGNYCYQAVDGYVARKLGQNEKSDMPPSIHTKPGRPELGRFLNDIRSRSVHNLDKGPQGNALHAKARLFQGGRDGLCELVIADTYMTGAFVKDRALDLAGMLLAHELGATPRDGRAYIEIVAASRGKAWPYKGAILPENEEQMKATIAEYDTMAANRPPPPVFKTQQSAPSSVLPKKFIGSDHPRLAHFINTSGPSGKILFTAAAGRVEEKDLLPLNLLIEGPQETALTSVHRQHKGYFDHLPTRYRRTITLGETRGYCQDMLDGLWDNIRTEDDKKLAAPLAAKMYGKAQLEVPAEVQIFLPAAAGPGAPVPPTAPIVTTAPAPMAAGTGTRDDQTAAALVAALTPGERRAGSARSETPEPPAPTPALPPAPPTPAAPVHPLPVLQAELAAVEQQIAAAKKDTIPLGSIRTDNKGARFLHAKGVSYHAPFIEGSQILANVKTAFKDSPPDLAFVNACEGKMKQGEFLLISRLMLTPHPVSIVNAYASLKKQEPEREPWSLLKARDNFARLIDLAAADMGEDDATKEYLTTLRQRAGLEQGPKPEKTIKADKAQPPPKSPTPPAKRAASPAASDAKYLPGELISLPGPRLHAAGVDRSKAFEDGCEIMPGVRKSFAGDISATGLINACRGQVNQGEFLILSRLMLCRGEMDLSYTGRELNRTSTGGQRFGKAETRAYFNGLIDRALAGPEGDKIDAGYVQELKAKLPSFGRVPKTEPIAQDESTGVTAKKPHRKKAGDDTFSFTPIPLRRTLQEPFSRAVRLELAEYVPGTPEAAAAQFAAEKLADLPFMIVSSRALRPREQRLSFADQAARIGHDESDLRRMFRAATRIVRAEAKAIGKDDVLASPPSADMT